MREVYQMINRILFFNKGDDRPRMIALPKPNGYAERVIKGLLSGDDEQLPGGDNCFAFLLGTNRQYGSCFVSDRSDSEAPGLG
jgi:hypothetical protein